MRGYICVKTNIYRLIYLDHLAYLLDHLLVKSTLYLYHKSSNTNTYLYHTACAQRLPKATCSFISVVFYCFLNDDCIYAFKINLIHLTTTAGYNTNCVMSRVSTERRGAGLLHQSVNEDLKVEQMLSSSARTAHPVHVCVYPLKSTPSKYCIYKSVFMFFVIFTVLYTLYEINSNFTLTPIICFLPVFG